MIIRVNSYSAMSKIQYRETSYIELDVDVDAFEDHKEVINHIGEHEILSHFTDTTISDEFKDRELVGDLDITEIVDKFGPLDLLEHLEISDEELLDKCDESSIITRARDIQINKVL